MSVFCVVASPPLPPPPEQGDGNTFDFMPPPPGQDGQYAVDDISNLERRFHHSSRIQPEWVPEEYLEKGMIRISVLTLQI